MPGARCEVQKLDHFRCVLRGAARDQISEILLVQRQQQIAFAEVRCARLLRAMLGKINALPPRNLESSAICGLAFMLPDGT